MQRAIAALLDLVIHHTGAMTIEGRSRRMKEAEERARALRAKRAYSRSPDFSSGLRMDASATRRN